MVAMGFFSQDCEHCTHPVLCAQATEDKNKWMTQACAVLPNGSILIGEYDGYGRLDGRDAIGTEQATVYHIACWEVLGKPTEHKGESRSSEDQGWFFDDDTHNWPTPAEAKAHPSG